MSRIRILVVEDSLTVRMRLLEVLNADPTIEVVGDTPDGRKAVAMCQQLRPDVVSLDMVLPGLSGLQVTEEIMARCPTPIVIVSASLNRGEIFNTFDALRAGAVDVLEKPTLDENDANWARQLLSTVKMAARIRVITHVRPRSRTITPAPVVPACTWKPADAPRLIAIGASTGGPAAVMTILQQLPAGFRLPIVLLLHISDAFGPSFIEWLNSVSPFRVTPAREGDPLPEPGAARVIMAPPGRHLVVSQGVFRLTNAVERHSCRPSIDTLFESLAAELGSNTIGCLLTGMGRDGAVGLRAIRQAGGLTIAQDATTSVVFGMPGAAIELQAAQLVLPLGEIAPVLAEFAAQGGY